MNSIMEYIFTPNNWSATQYFPAEEEIAQNPREPSPVNGCYLSPPSGQVRSKHSYRASYPQSQREMHKYVVASKAFQDDYDSRWAARSSPMEPRPRRSSLRQPGKPRRRNSTPPKRVHFSSADIVYEPFDYHDRETIEQVMDMLNTKPQPTSSIPPKSSYSVVLRHTDAAREYPRPALSRCNLAQTVNNLQAELVGDAGRPRLSRSQTIGIASEKIKNGGRSPRESRKNGHNELSEHSEHSEGELSFDSQNLRRNKRHAAVEKQLYYSRGSPARRYTMAQCESRPGCVRTETTYRPRGQTIPQVRSNRSSLESESTLVNAEQAWAPAKVVLRNSDVHYSDDLDANKPVVHVPNDGNTLHRSDAQRLPEVPRRNKVLQKVTRMWA